MKVFNWVHCRFLHGLPCTSSLQDSGLEKDVRSRASVERDVLLGHGGHMGLDAFKDWKDGFLTIGTLAIGALETSKYEIIKEGVDDDDDRDHHHDDTDEENNYLDFNHDTDFESSPLMKIAKFSHEFEKIDVDEVHNEIVKEEVANKNFVDKLKNKRRVTLADLFSEDSDHQLFDKVKEINEGAEKNVIIIAKPNLKIKPTSRAKNGLSKAKKLLKEELLPTKNLNQLMKRMMKRKIHPDLEGKKEIQMTNNGLDIQTDQQDINETNDSESLLLIQDTMV